MADRCDEIAAEHERRHVHNVDQDRCDRCGAFVDKGERDGGTYRYECWRCGPVVETIMRRLADVTTD